MKAERYALAIEPVSAVHDQIVISAVVL
jgi:hypothetical protein